MPVDKIRYREWNQLLMDGNTRSSMVAAGDNDH